MRYHILTLMRFMKQFGVILAITFLGEILRYVIPLPIPASIYGLVLMLLALKSGVVKLDQVKETGDFLIEIMPMLFIPAAVISLIILSFNLLGDGLRDAFDPKLKN